MAQEFGLLPKGGLKLLRERIHEPKPGIVPGLIVMGAGIAEADDEFYAVLISQALVLDLPLPAFRLASRPRGNHALRLAALRRGFALLARTSSLRATGRMDTHNGKITLGAVGQFNQGHTLRQLEIGEPNGLIQV